MQRCIDEEKMREEVMGSRFLNQEGEVALILKITTSQQH